MKGSLFDLSHERKMTLNMGNLYPILSQEIIPGDKFTGSTEILIRMAPLLAPVMHRVNVYTHFFFVPNRLIWSGWEDFITGGEDGLIPDSPPMIELNNSNKTEWGARRLADYLGVPSTMITGTLTRSVFLNALPFRAYQLIFDEWYRDQTLTTSNLPDFDLAGDITQSAHGSDIVKHLQLRVRAWEKDYFTSALPWTQRGGEAGAPVTQDPLKPNILRKSTDDSIIGGATLTSDGSGQLAGGGFYAWLDNSDEDKVMINDLRTANRLQRWLEKNARGGSRYIENILEHFGVKSSDARLQRPEYLGGGKQPVMISEVLSTTKDTAETQPLAELGGHGIALGTTNRFSKRFEEHGWLMGIMSIMPRTAYYQGIPRELLKKDRFDYYWPEFAHLGEQEVDRDEIYADLTASKTAGAFGYQQRYAEYKFKPDSVVGDMRADLDHFHFGRLFASEPLLNDAFIRATNVADRSFATVGAITHHCYAQVFNKLKAWRPMPYQANPKL